MLEISRDGYISAIVLLIVGIGIAAVTIAYCIMALKEYQKRLDFIIISSVGVIMLVIFCAMICALLLLVSGRITIY